MTAPPTLRVGDYVVTASPDGHGRVLLMRIGDDGAPVAVRTTFASRSDAVSRFEQHASALAQEAGTRAFRHDADGQYHLLEP